MKVSRRLSIVFFITKPLDELNDDERFLLTMSGYIYWPI